MIDFVLISTKSTKKDAIEIYPKFLVKKSDDLMIRGSDFYAIWLEEKGLWSTDEQDALMLIDKELDAYAEKYKEHYDGSVKVLHMWDAESGMIDKWHKYCQKQMRDSYHVLDEQLIFSDTVVTKKDYASKKLTYPLKPSEPAAFLKLINTLYSEAEAHKIMWCIGAIVTGDSRKLQKFMVLYGSAGTGKSTVIDIMQQLFEGYYAVFDAKALGSTSNQFALESFKTNPLVAIQHDGDLSHIEDNTRLNSLVSHELMTINEKFKSTYANQFKTFLVMGTNKPVKITDGRSGLLRRLIDVSPTGNLLPRKEYNALKEQVKFELGAIACYCRDLYLEDPSYYDDYVPYNMMGASNDFYNFMVESYFIFKKNDGVTLDVAWKMYLQYCEEAKVGFPFTKRVFKEELRNYFENFSERANTEDGTRVRSVFSGFKFEKFNADEQKKKKREKPVEETRQVRPLVDFKEQPSIFDKECGDCIAQYATEAGTPNAKWIDVKTTIKNIDTHKLHYVKVPSNHIVIDFDIKGDDGEKSLEKNIEEALKWPPTYAELSKSGCGIHLHYIYTGDVEALSRIYAEHIEIKIFTGNSSLRRKLTKCNNLPIAEISSGLPLKGADKMINFDGLKNEKALRTLIRKAIDKDYHGATKPNIDLIFWALEESYNNKSFHYDVEDMYDAVLKFAAGSTNNADYCLKKVAEMHFWSDDISPNSSGKEDDPIVFFDVEVFPNLFLVNWKIEGENQPVHRMINPSQNDIDALCHMKLVGFNNRRYDNHILYGRLIGYTNEQLYILSKNLTSKDKQKDAFFREAYNISYTDIYDFSSKKQSLKKFEIELGIHHQELGLPWDKPVAEELWEKVAEYCDNDVIATEAVFNARKDDFKARCILADLAGMTVNDTTNSLTAKIIFGNDKHPQSKFNYRNMGDVSQIDKNYITKYSNEFTVFDCLGRPIFPGYTFTNGKSLYRGTDPREGGRVYANPGMYGLVALLDIASMHPHSAIAEQLFGEYTSRFQDLVNIRIHIKHKEFDIIKNMWNGILAKYMDDVSSAKALSGALKIAINAVYGETSASFDNAFRDKRNVDNIVAKRGALFMINLQHEVENRGFKVAHIKTDSIKIPDATKEIVEFVMEYGKLYGYTFEFEAVYDRMCLVNDAVYIAKFATPDICEKYFNFVPDENKEGGGTWTATGTQFQIPYVFKTLFSKESIEFKDLCETKSVTSALYLDFDEQFISEREQLENSLKVLKNEWKCYRKKNKLATTDEKGENIFDKWLTSDERPDDPEELEFCSEAIRINDKLKTLHSYTFIGKVGLFCPIQSGYNAGVLVREQEDKNGEKKYVSVTGAKGYRWLETEMVENMNLKDKIDISYYNALANDAIESISNFGDYEWFVSSDPYYPPEYKDGKPIYVA